MNGGKADMDDRADRADIFQQPAQLGGGYVVDGRLAVGDHDNLSTHAQQLPCKGNHAQHYVRACTPSHLLTIWL
jgi:hypothetical protein